MYRGNIRQQVMCSGNPVSHLQANITLHSLRELGVRGSNLYRELLEGKFRITFIKPYLNGKYRHWNLFVLMLVIY